MKDFSEPLTIAAVALGIVALWAVLRKLTTVSLAEIVGEAERGLVYRHGRFTQEVGPGRHWMLFGRRMVKVSTAERVFQVANQEVLSADRLPVRASALVTYRVTHPRKATEKSEGGHFTAVYYASQLALRDVLAGLQLEALVDARTTLDATLAERAAEAFLAQGCELLKFQLRDIVLPADVKRLATDVTRARMEAAAALERARGEQAALRLLANAARLVKGNPELMNLRLLHAIAPAPGKPAPTVVLGAAPGIVPLKDGPLGTAQAAPETE